MVTFDIVAVTALVISFFAFAERFRGSQRARQETNMLLLSNQLGQIYDMFDDNLAEVLRTRGKARLKKGFTRGRLAMIQKFHIHLDTLMIMIKMESGAFRRKIFGRSQYYDEMIQWYCCVHKLYNDLLDLLGVEDSGFLHDGLKDPHRTRGRPPLFLANNPRAIRYQQECVIALKKSPKLESQ